MFRGEHRMSRVKAFVTQISAGGRCRCLTYADRHGEVGVCLCVFVWGDAAGSSKKPKLT